MIHSNVGHVDLTVLISFPTNVGSARYRTVRSVRSSRIRNDISMKLNIIFLAETLLLRTPQSHQKGFHEALYKTMQIKDVLSYRDQKLWKFSSSVICASIVVQLAPSGNEQAIINQITQYFKGNKG